MKVLLDTHIVIWALNGDKRLPKRARAVIEDEGNAPVHKDPFDRMLISQAKADKLVFMTHDSLIPYYNEKCILSV